MPKLANNVAEDIEMDSPGGSIDPIGEGTGAGQEAATEPANISNIFSEELGEDDGMPAVEKVVGAGQRTDGKDSKPPTVEEDNDTPHKSTKEPAKEEETDEAEETTEAKPDAAAQTNALPSKRDYSGLGPDEVEALRQTRNKGFATLKPILLERKELRARADTLAKELEEAKKGGLPDSWAQHKDAFILSPDFGRITSERENVSNLYEFYKEQLSQCRAGSDWKEAIPDGRGGYTTTVRAASSQADVNLMTYVNELGMKKAQLDSSLQQLATTHTQRHTQLMDFVKKTTDTFFPGLTEAELSKPEKKQYVEEIKKITESFPKALHNDPLLPALARAHVVIQDLVSQMNTKKQAAEKTILKQGNKVIASPTKSAVVNGGQPKAKRDIAAAYRMELSDDE